MRPKFIQGLPIKFSNRNFQKCITLQAYQAHLKMKMAGKINTKFIFMIFIENNIQQVMKEHFNNSIILRSLSNRLTVKPLKTKCI